MHAPQERSPQTRRRPGQPSYHNSDHEAAPRQVRTQAAKISEETATEGQTRLIAQICIAGCALLWGTYTPAIRLAYNSPLPPDPAVVTAVRATIQATVLFTVLQLQSNDQGKLDDDVAGDDGASMASQDRMSDQLDPTQPLSFVRGLLNTTSGSFWIMGAELGFWNFAAGFAQVPLT